MINLDAAQTLTVICASLIDDGHSDHEILNTIEAELRVLRAAVENGGTNATEIAVKRSAAWSKRS